jgi:hypothetical protein
MVPPCFCLLHRPSLRNGDGQQLLSKTLVTSPPKSPPRPQGGAASARNRGLLAPEMAFDGTKPISADHLFKPHRRLVESMRRWMRSKLIYKTNPIWRSNLKKTWLVGRPPGPRGTPTSRCRERRQGPPRGRGRPPHELLFYFQQSTGVRGSWPARRASCRRDGMGIFTSVVTDFRRGAKVSRVCCGRSGRSATFRDSQSRRKFTSTMATTVTGLPSL